MCVCEQSGFNPSLLQFCLLFDKTPFADLLIFLFNVWGNESFIAGCQMIIIYEDPVAQW
jgi:hypothetical protein